jgi:ubiquinone/menaquinone biosynthesis C-methylase UbiE
MEFTGERVIPGQTDLTLLFEEHLARYFFAGEFVEDRRILDLGCGTGYGSYYLRQKGARFVLGTDIDSEAVEYACSHYQALNLGYVQSNALQLPLCQKSFDVVVSFEVLEHLQAATTYLAEISRVLTDEGWLIGSTPNKLVHSMGAEKPHNPFHWREYSPVELESLLREFFDHVFILGQMPFYGSIIGRVPVDLNEAIPGLEFLTDNAPWEHSLDDNMYLVYLAGKPEARIDIVQKHLGSRYYLGQSAIHHQMRTSAYIQSLESENDKLWALVKGYQSGKFVRVMSFIHRWRARLFSSRRPPQRQLDKER